MFFTTQHTGMLKALKFSGVIFAIKTDTIADLSKLDEIGKLFAIFQIF